MDSHNSDKCNHLHNLSNQRYFMFESQDNDKGHFDVVFQFADKQQLHTHSFILWPISKVFEAMIFGEWATNKNKPIKISTNTFEDFKEFLKFFYFGECNLTPENISIIVDLAEAYDVEALKDYCDLYLMSNAVNVENAIKGFELAKKYSLTKMMEKITAFISENTEDVLELNEFYEISIECLIDIAKFELLNVAEETFFDAILKWAKHQLSKIDAMDPSTEEYKLALKNILTDILPYIRFPTMSMEYLSRVVAPIGYLFTYEEFSKILLDSITLRSTGINSTFVSLYHNKPRAKCLKFIQAGVGEAVAYVFNETTYNLIKNLNGRESNKTQINQQIHYQNVHMHSTYNHPNFHVYGQNNFNPQLTSASPEFHQWNAIIPCPQKPNISKFINDDEYCLVTDSTNLYLKRKILIKHNETILPALIFTNTRKFGHGPGECTITTA